MLRKVFTAAMDKDSPVRMIAEIHNMHVANAKITGLCLAFAGFNVAENC